MHRKYWFLCSFSWTHNKRVHSICDTVLAGVFGGLANTQTVVFPTASFTLRQP